MEIYKAKDYDSIFAVVPSYFSSDRKYIRVRQEKNFYGSYLVLDTRTAMDAHPPQIELRLGMSSSYQSYAALWIRGKEHEVYALGKTTGHGYHKPSAALSDALSEAGITLSSNIDGRGDSAIVSALSSISSSIGMDPETTIIIHCYA